MTLFSQLFKKKSFDEAAKAALNTTAIEAGQTLADRYRLASMIGQGSMGRVFRADDTLLGNVSVAVKVLSQGLLNDRMAEQFAREARTGALLGHQSIHIVRVLDYGIHEDRFPFYVMEFVDGGTLEQELAIQPLDLPRFAKLMSQVCVGLHSAHQGLLIDNKLHCIVHRDIKPSNIFITHNPSLGELAKILDFGIADFIQSAGSSKQQQQAMGTLAYASAEQLEGLTVDPRSDIYSLGITMFEALTGHLPIVPVHNSFMGWVEAQSNQLPRKIVEVAPHLTIPPALNQLIQSCLEKKIENRPQTIDEVLGVLKTISPISATMGQPSPAAIEQSIDDILDQIISDSGMQSGHSPGAAETQVFNLSTEDQLWRSPWPTKKPIAEIVFAQSFQSAQQEVAAVWVMLANAELQQRTLTRRYTEFIFDFKAYPMMGWITGLFDDDLHLRCFPCYIDLKESRSRAMIQQIVQTGTYLFVLYDINQPQQPVHVATLQVTESQRQLLIEKLELARHMQPPSSPSVGKMRLREAYRALKPNLPQKLKQLLATPQSV